MSADEDSRPVQAIYSVRRGDIIADESGMSVLGVMAETSKLSRYCAAIYPAHTRSVTMCAGVGQIESDVQPVSEWEFTTVDYDRNEGGLVRFNLRELASVWASGAAPNYGILITTDDVSRTHANASLQGALLTVRYGFSK